MPKGCPKNQGNFKGTFLQEGILEIPSAQEKMVMNSLLYSPKETYGELEKHRWTRAIEDQPG